MVTKRHAFTFSAHSEHTHALKSRDNHSTRRGSARPLQPRQTAEAAFMGMNRAVMESIRIIPSNMALRAASAALRRRVAAAFFAAALRRIVPSEVVIWAFRAVFAVADVKRPAPP